MTVCGASRTRRFPIDKPVAKTEFDQLVAEVAKLAYPRLPLCDAKKKVRNRTDYARRRGHLAVEGNDSVGLTADRMGFLRWAQQVWPSIADDLRLSNDSSLAAVASPPALRSFLTSLPTDIEVLRREYVAQSAALNERAEELAKCWAQIEALEAQLKALKETKQRLAKMRSEYGKKGGRGHEK